jgi:hypothetical protein
MPSTHPKRLRLLMARLGLFAAIVIVAPLVASCAQPGSVDQRPVDDVTPYLQSREIPKVEAILDEAQRRFEAGQLSEVELRNAYRPFYKLTVTAYGDVQDWAAGSPSSYPAHLALGIVFRMTGSNARGEGSIGETEQWRLDRMAQWFRLSDKEVRASLPLTPKPYLSVIQLLQMSLYQGDRASRRALLDQAVGILPDAQLARQLYANSLLPRWGGSYAEFDAFVDETARMHVPSIIVTQLRAVEADDQGDVARRMGEIEASDVLFEKALSLGKTVGPTFTTEWLIYSRFYLCTKQRRSTNCP